MRPSDRTVALVVVAVLVLSTAVVWDVAADREQLAVDTHREHAIDQQVAVRQAAGDYDADGIPDDADVCPTRPETSNDFQDGDGCPDIVATTGAS